MKRLRLDDKILRVRDEPEPPPAGKLPLVCIHGAGMSSVVFMDLVRRLAPGRRVVAPDLPGHGQSDPWSDDITLDGYRDAVGTVCARLQIPRAVLLGHSMGAAVALRCALSWPDRVAGLVLVNGAARLRVSDEVMALLARALPEHAHASDGPVSEPLPGALADMLFSPETPAEVRARWQAVLLGARREVVLGDFRACAGFDAMADAAALRLPLLCITGSDDYMVPARRSAETAARVPGGRCEIVPGGGHLIHLEQPDAFHRILDPFLQNIG